MSGVITHNGVKNEVSIFKIAELQPIIVFYSRHFVRYLGICSRIYVKLVQLISGIITHNSIKNEVSILING